MFETIGVQVSVFMRITMRRVVMNMEQTRSEQDQKFGNNDVINKGFGTSLPFENTQSGKRKRATCERIDTFERTGPYLVQHGTMIMITEMTQAADGSILRNLAASFIFGLIE